MFLCQAAEGMHITPTMLGVFITALGANLFATGSMIAWTVKFMRNCKKEFVEEKVCVVTRELVVEKITGLDAKVDANKQTMDREFKEVKQLIRENHTQ
jgi:hypothetical protein